MSAVSPVSLFLADQPQSDCPNCGFLAWCLPAELELRDLQRFNKLVTHQRLIKREGIVYRAGSALGSLYVVCSGFLKTTLPHDDGRDHVTGFSMTGELIGVDAIGAGKHTCNTIALEDSRVCGIRYADFEELGHAIPKLQHRFHQVMSAEIARDHEAMFLLGSARANERVAIFLLDLSKRFFARGYSETHFRLPMTRDEIGSYLGLKLETVSRAFAHFKDIQSIEIKGKDVEIRNLLQLQEAIGDHEMHRPAR